jgi:4a-hydroxytetrahydrobiopterin dehydratase
MSGTLTEQELSAVLPSLTGWTVQDGKLMKVYQLSNFKEAMTFVNHVAEHAETVDHHPNILIYYNKVILELISHDVGGISQRDIQFAQSF